MATHVLSRSVKAYPEELLSIEAFTKGQIKVGDWITAENIDVVVDRQPFLGSSRQGWNGNQPNWNSEKHSGARAPRF